MSTIWYVFIIFLYSVGLCLFGTYLKLIEVADFLKCFACKELNTLENAYDYIVVGSGSAGSVIALRLAEDKDTSVLVLEAGFHGGRFLDIPAIGPLLQLSSVDWQYRTVPQDNSSKGFEKQVNIWPMGRIVGGTGRLNNMVYLRGHPSDFQDWFKDLPGFNYEMDILRYFKKAEDQQGFYKSDSKYHSQHGPLVVEDLHFESPLVQAVLDAAEALGYPIRDLNGRYNTGFMRTQVNSNSGARSTPSHRFYTKHNPNLVLQINTLVEQILLKSNYEAYAVRYSYLGERKTVRARKGIILSAGVIGTPKLLMLSGIGPREHLNSVGIRTQVDLPVGDNLQDHITTGPDLILLNTTMGINAQSMMSPIAAFNYFYSSSGPWTYSGCEVVGVIDTESKTYCHKSLDLEKLASILRINEFGDKLQCIKTNHVGHRRTRVLDKYLPAAQRYKLSKFVSDIKYNNVTDEDCAVDEKRQPDLQLMIVPVGVSTDCGKHMKKASGLNQDVWDKYFAPLIGQTTVSIIPVVLHPKSRGTVRLLDKSVYSKPVINPNYLSDPHDMEILLKGIDLVKKIIKTEPMQKLGAKLNDNKFPGCESFQFDSRPYWECYVRHFTVTTFHPCGTCKMGSAGKIDVVVDYDFHVHGTNKLFIADASIIPSSPSGNINSATVMIGEKAADQLKYINYLNKHKCQQQETFLPPMMCLK